MRVTSISAANVFSFPSLYAELGPGTTIVTGPNGVGKSNLGRCLDLVCSVMELYARDNSRVDRASAYEAAGHWGSESFEVAVSLVFDQEWERDLVLSFVQSAFAYGMQPEGTEGATPASLEAFVRAFLDEESVSILHEGTLHVWYDGRRSSPWSARWEFGLGDQAWYVVLVGSEAGQLHSKMGPKLAVQGESVLSLTQTLYDAIGRETPLRALASLGGVDVSRSVALSEALPTSGIVGIAFDVPTSSNSSWSEPDCRRELTTRLGASIEENRIVGFTRVMWAILRRGIVLTDNRRLPARRDFTVEQLQAAFDLRDGSGVAAELFRLKDGSVAERQRYDRIVHLYAQLTGCQLGLRVRPVSEEVLGLRIEPTVVSERGEIPMSFSGAGREEALVLATLLSQEQGRLLVLDEPAVNLEPTMQRRLISVLRDAGQVLVITHNPDMVPIDGLDDLSSIVRLAPVEGGVVVRGAPQLTTSERMSWQKMLEPSHVRALLFAAQVILCEGSTETGALSQWWRDTTALGLPNPEAAHTPIISVGGDASFGTYVNYLDAFGIPWAIVADGPALRGSSKLANQLAKRPNASLAERPADEDDFEAWRAYWRQVGVFTLADQFGDDGSKAGEFEAFADRVDSVAYAQAKKDGNNSKPRVGTCFAMEHPTPPTEVTVLYQQIMKHFGYVKPGKVA